jgi:hypothetical protein
VGETVYRFGNGLEKFADGLDENWELFTVEAALDLVFESTPELTSDGLAIVDLHITMDILICLEYPDVFEEPRGLLPCRLHIGVGDFKIY